MKRFLVFSAEIYEALGGWNDFVGQFDDAAEAKAAAEKALRGHGRWDRSDWRWSHVIDTQDPEHPDGIVVLDI